MANYYKYNANMGDRTYFTSVVTNTAGNAKRFFSNVESEIYFGNQEMEDLCQFQFSIDEKVLPIYGYNCYYASEIVSGQRIIQGQFVVNYTDSKLIQSTLSNIDQSVLDSILVEDYVPGGDLHHAIYDKSFDIMIGYGYYNIKDKETYNATSQTILGAKISGMQKILDTTGQPILEVYNFIAKDFIEEKIEQAQVDSNNKNNNKDQDDNNIKLPYVCSDYYNKAQVINNEALAKKYECPHFEHNIIFVGDMIQMHVTSSNAKDIAIVDGTAYLQVTEVLDEYLGESKNLPVFGFSIHKDDNCRAVVEEGHIADFEKCMSKGKKEITCAVEYIVKFKINDDEEEIDVKFDDAILYLY